MRLARTADPSAFLSAAQRRTLHQPAPPPPRVEHCSGDADGVATFDEAVAPTDDKRHALLLHGHRPADEAAHAPRGVLIEEMGQTCLAEPDADADAEEARTLRPRQAAAITDRIAMHAATA